MGTDFSSPWLWAVLALWTPVTVGGNVMWGFSVAYTSTLMFVLPSIILAFRKRN